MATPSKKKILVLLNPIGGGGKAKALFEKVVEKLFKEKGVTYELKTTDSVGHAKRIAASLAIDVYGAIVCVSGDGLFHEVINGIRSRSDSEEVFRTLIFGIVPAGTANGLATSFGFANVERAVEAIAKESVVPFDLISFKDHDGTERACSGLSVSWGFIGDHDNLTEREYRWMGPTISTTIVPVMCFLWKSFYRAKISFIPTFPPQQEGSLSKRGTSFEKEGDWYSVEGEFWGITACNTSHIGADTLLAPQAKVNDGSFDLVIMHACGYLDGFRMLTGAETGSHVNHPYIDIIKAKEFKIEPSATASKTNISIDGEVLPSQNFSLEILPSKARVFAWPS